VSWMRGAGPALASARDPWSSLELFTNLLGMSHIAMLQNAANRPESSRHSGLEAVLENNLCSLLAAPAGAEKSEETIVRILRADRGDHVIIGGPNPPLYRHQNVLREFLVGQGQLHEEVKSVRDGDSVFVFGISLGEQVAHLLRTRPKAKITVWDRDPYMVRLALTRQDYGASLRSGRLTLAIGADLVDYLPNLEKCQVVLHPVFRGVYADEMRLVSESVTGVAPSEGRRWIGLGMGGVVVSDIGESLRSEGYSVFPLEVRRWKPAETTYALNKLKLERVITVNFEPEVAEACQAHGVPLVVWDVDPKTDRTPVPPKSASNIRVFTLREDNVETLRASGFTHVQHLPVGTDVEKRRPMQLNPSETERFSSPVTFVGSSLIDRARRFKRLFLQLYASFDCSSRESFQETEDRLESLLAAERMDYSTYVTDQLVEESFGEFLQAAQRCGTPDDPQKWVAEIVASQKRIAYVSALADEGIHVWGDSDWKRVATKNRGMRYMGAASFGHELTLVYNGAGINVDVNRIYQPDVVQMRVFDVLACGGFLIAEHSDALAHLFEVGKELESYRTLEELEQKVAHYRANPHEARAIAERGLAAVRTRHTMRQRVKTLLAPF
jgi:spore maturation protein CgeB